MQNQDKEQILHDLKNLIECYKLGVDMIVKYQYSDPESCDKLLKSLKTKESKSDDILEKLSHVLND